MNHELLLLRIIELVAQKMGVPPPRILARGRAASDDLARKMVYHIARKRQIPYATVARVMCRDASTITHGYNTLREQLAVDAKLRETATHIEDVLDNVVVDAPMMRLADLEARVRALEQVLERLKAVVGGSDGV